MKPLISIIIPVFNDEKYIANAINSIINQDIKFELLELIIIDDKSTDNSKSIIQDYENKYENIRCFYLSENNGVPGKLRNIGINNASADYIMFCDSDDYYSPNYCKVMFNFVTKNHDIDFISSRYNFIKNNKFEGLNRTFLDKKGPVIKFSNINDCPDLVYTVINLTIWNKIFKRNFLLENNIKFYNQRWDEDFYFCLNCFIKSKDGFIFLNDYAGYNYRLKDNEAPKSERVIKSVNDADLAFQDVKTLLKNEKNAKNLNFDKIISEHLIMTTHYFLGNNLEKNKQIELLNKLKPYYKSYRLTTRLINNIPLFLNICLNIFIKLSALSNNFIIIFSKLYKKIIY